MDRLRKSYKETKKLHHAYLLAGVLLEGKEAVIGFLKNTVGVSTVGNPDVLHFHFTSLGVDDARALRGHAMRKPLSGSQFFIILFSFATPEAQNALLKLLEEPNKGTYFFILVPTIGTLLPTVRSRLATLHLPQFKTTTLGENFLKAGKGERVAQLKKTIDEKNKEDLLSLIASLEAIIHTKLKTEEEREEFTEAADSLLSARRYLQSRSASVKMIVEYLATVIPN